MNGIAGYHRHPHGESRGRELSLEQLDPADIGGVFHHCRKSDLRAK